MFIVKNSNAPQLIKCMAIWSYCISIIWAKFLWLFCFNIQIVCTMSCHIKKGCPSVLYTKANSRYELFSGVWHHSLLTKDTAVYLGQDTDSRNYYYPQWSRNLKNKVYVIDARNCIHFFTFNKKKILHQHFQKILTLR